MPVFYRGPLATITHEVISVPRIGRRILAIDDLGAVRALVVGSTGDALRHRILSASSILALFFVPAVGEASAVLAVVVGLVLVGYAGACLRVRSAVRYQLVARIRDGEWITLVETPDRVQFEQVGRGLRRALEYREDLS